MRGGTLRLCQEIGKAKNGMYNQSTRGDASTIGDCFRQRGQSEIREVSEVCMSR